MPALAQFPSSPEQLQTRPQSEVPPVGRGAPERSYSDETAAPFIGELGKRSGDRPATMTEAERSATRERYDDLGPTEAADLARRMFPDELGTPVFNLADPPGASLVRTSGRFAAVLKDDESGETGLMLSSSPVRQTIENGADPVDLTLERVGDTFKPEVPLIDTRFTKDPQEALSFPGREVSIGLATTSERDPLVRDDRANHFEVRTDTDLILTPRPEGAELFLQLRGPDAPTEFLVDVDMPEGATLREFKPENPIPGDTEGPWPVEVVEDGRQLAVVYPPSAHDAEGRPVASRLRIDGANLRLTVEHRGRLLAYPVLADPEVYVPQYEGQPSSWSGWRHQNFRSQTSIQQNHYPFFGASLGNYAYGPGLYLSMPTNQGYYNGDFSELIWQAPTDVFITRTRLNWMSHSPFYSGTFHGITNAPNSAWEGGLGYVNQNNERGPNPFGTAQHAFYGVTHDFCYGSPNCNLGGSDQNNVVVGLQALPPGCCMGTGANKATAQINSVELYLGDRFTPTLIGGVPPSRDWFDDTDTRTRTVTPQVTDRGLGVKQIELAGAQTGETLRGLPCTGHPYESPCPKDTRAAPRSLSYGVAEGVSTLTVSGLDATLKRTGGGTWTEKVDRSPPVITSVTGRLFDHREQPPGADQRQAGLSDSSYALFVRAQDAHSGVTSIDVTAIDAVGRRTPLASRAGGTFDGDVPFGALPDGAYTIEISARDVVGAPVERHVAVQTFPVLLDRAGDIQRAELYDADPAVDGEQLAEEWTQAGTTNARHEVVDQIETRTTVPCTNASERRCAEQRTRGRADDGTLSVSDLFSVVRGSAEDDARVDAVAELQAIPRESRGTPTSIGPLADALKPWQRPPGGHGSQHQYFESATTSEDETDASVTTVRRLWVDATTGLPLRERVVAGEEVETDTFFTYGANRQTAAEAPPELFRIARPASPEEEEDTDYGTLDYEPEEPGPAGEPLSQEQEVEEAILLRQALGLRSDQDFVRGLLSDVTANLSERLGTVFTTAEELVVATRLRLQDNMDLVRDYGITRAPASFAGAYLDADGGGMVHVAFTRDAAEHLERLQAIFPLPNRLRVETVDATIGVLENLRDRIEADWGEGTLETDGLDVESVGVDEEVNAVLLGVPAVTAEQQAAIKMRYGDDVKLVIRPRTEPLRRIPPLVGGVRIESPGKRLADGRRRYGICSTGFSVRRTVLVRGVTRRVQALLTAGHCGRPGRRWLYRLTPDRQSGTNNIGTGRPLGAMRRNAEPATPPRTEAGKKIATVDAALVQLRTGLVAAPVVRIAKTRFLNVKGAQEASAGAMRTQSNKGDLICHLGATSFYAKPKPRCGPLTEIDVTDDYTDGFRRKHLNVAATYARGGDSGSAVYMENGLAVGLVSGSSRKRMLFTQISRALAGLGRPTLVTRGQTLTAPTATTGEATDFAPTATRLNGVVNPKGTSTTYSFEYGKETTYGSNTPQATLAADRAQHAVMATINGLAPDTTYHARLVATNTVGRRIGQDITFKTAAQPPAP